MLGSDFELSRRHLDLRQGRAVGAGRHRHADREDRRDHRRRDARRDERRAARSRGRRCPIRKAASAWPSRCWRSRQGAAPTAPRCWCATAPSWRSKVRLGEPELIKEAGSRALGLRVLKDQRAGRDLHVRLRARRRWSALRARDASSWRRWPSPIRLRAAGARGDGARACPSWTSGTRRCSALDVAEGIRRARAGEAAALQARQARHQLRGRDLRAQRGRVGVRDVGRVLGLGYRGTHVSLAVEPLCDDADGKKRNGYYWTASRFAGGLADAEAVGLEAARRTVAKLGARKIADRRGAGDLLARCRRAGCSASSRA